MKPLRNGFIRLYSFISVKDWNKKRVLGDDTDDKFWELNMLLSNVWTSCYAYQQQLGLRQYCPVYSRLSSRLVTCGAVLPVLFSSFQVEFYIDSDSPLRWIGDDFSQSRRPHLDEIDAVVAADVVMAIWYICERHPLI